MPWVETNHHSFDTHRYSAFRDLGYIAIEEPGIGDDGFIGQRLAKKE